MVPEILQATAHGSGQDLRESPTLTDDKTCAPAPDSVTSVPCHWFQVGQDAAPVVGRPEHLADQGEACRSRRSEEKEHTIEAKKLKEMIAPHFLRRTKGGQIVAADVRESTAKGMADGPSPRALSSRVPRVPRGSARRWARPEAIKFELRPCRARGLASSQVVRAAVVMQGSMS